MKTKLIALFTVCAPLAFGHGSLGEQASNSIIKAVELFSAQQPKEAQKRFSSITALKTGHEKFEVSILLDDKKTTFKFNCVEDESVEPVEWGCEAIN